MDEQLNNPNQQSEESTLPSSEEMVVIEDNTTKSHKNLKDSVTGIVKKYPKILIVVGVLFILSSVGVFAYSQKIARNTQSTHTVTTPSPSSKLENMLDAETSPSPSPSTSTTSTASPSPTSSPKPKTTTTPKPTATATPTPTPTPTSTPTPTPRTANPPRLTISYPTEGHNIEVTYDSICVVDEPAGGDHTGLQKRHSLNNSGMSSYVTNYALCINPQEGLNTLQIQYKNSYGDESQVYTRLFNFHKISNVSGSVNGSMYQDYNCNGHHDPDEPKLQAVTNVYFVKPPDSGNYGSVTTNSSGDFTFNTTFLNNETLTLTMNMITPSGYVEPPSNRYTYPTIILTSSNPTYSVDVPKVPGAYTANCN